MAGLGWGQVFWAGASAFAVAMAGFVAVGFRALLRKMAERARAGFVEWFGAAIDEHVAPKFDEIREELQATAEATQRKSIDAAEAVKAENRDLIHAEVTPLKQTMDDQHAEIMHVVEDHVQADAAAFARIEERHQET